MALKNDNYVRQKNKASAIFCTFATYLPRPNIAFTYPSCHAISVGYAQSGLKNGGTFVVPQFINVGETTILDLQSLKAVGDDASDNVQIQTLDAGGYTVDAYDWNDWAVDEPCWVDADYTPVTEVSVAPGQGFWVMGSKTAQGLQSAGKVGTSDVVVSLRNGGSATGNPFPVALDLQDIVAEGDSASDNVQIQLLDAGGYTLESYDWNDWALDTPCWVDGDYNAITGVEIAPGQGLWVMGSSSAQSIRFPAPEL